MPPADNLRANEQLTGPHAAGINSILPKEHGSQFFYLPIIRHSDEQVGLHVFFSANHRVFGWGLVEIKPWRRSLRRPEKSYLCIPLCFISRADVTPVLVSGSWSRESSSAAATRLLPLQVCALCSWDSSIHDSVHLNRVTPPHERIYLIVKAAVQLSHPASMELVLRKRIAVNIYNKQVVLLLRLEPLITCISRGPMKLTGESR